MAMAFCRMENKKKESVTRADIVKRITLAKKAERDTKPKSIMER